MQVTICVMFLYGGFTLLLFSCVPAHYCRPIECGLVDINSCLVSENLLIMLQHIVLYSPQA